MMRAFKLIIIPLLVTSIITGMTALGKSSGRIGKLAFTYYLFTTVTAIVLGIILVLLINPGKFGQEQQNTLILESIPLETLKLQKNPENQTSFTSLSDSDSKILEEKEQEHSVPLTSLQFIDILRSLIPDNIFYATVALDVTKAHSEYENPAFDFEDDPKSKVFHTDRRLGSANILGLVSISIIVAMLMNQLNTKVAHLRILIEELNEVVLAGIQIIINFVPIGVCSLIAGCIYEMDGDVSLTFQKIGLYVMTVLIGLLIHWFLILPLIYYFFRRENPYHFIFGLKRALLTAFGTSSSSAALPLTMDCCEKNLNINPKLSNFILPLGCTVNMDGTALLEGVAAITIAQMEGVDLNVAQIVSLLVTATLCSIGASSIPSAGLIMLTMILEGLGLNADNIALLWGIDWILDRFRTCVNITGDAIGCAVVETFLSEDELDSSETTRMDEIASKD